MGRQGNPGVHMGAAWTGTLPCEFSVSGIPTCLWRLGSPSSPSGFQKYGSEAPWNTGPEAIDIWASGHVLLAHAGQWLHG